MSQLDEIKRSLLFFEIYKSIQDEIDKSTLLVSDVKRHAAKLLQESVHHIQIENHLFQLKLNDDENSTTSPSEAAQEESPPDGYEPLDYLRKAQTNWEKCVVKSINSMCTELAVPLSRKRSSKDESEFAKKFNDLTLGASYTDEAYKKLRPVYSSADFFEVLVAVKNTNLESPSICHTSLGLIQAQLHCPSSTSLKQMLHQLTGVKFQMGVDDMIESNKKDPAVNDWYKLGQRVVSHGHSAAAQQLLKQGCLAGLRRPLWLTMLNLSITDAEKLYFDQLKSFVFEYDMLVDHLIMKDVRLTTVNDDSFFVFEDLLYQILLVFSRDTQLLNHFQQAASSPPKSYIRGKLGIQECCVHYPPSGVIPFHGFSMFAAPLCYIYANSAELYFVFRALYTRYFFRLHSISSHPQGILSLCILFERLLQSEEPMLFKHMLDIGAQPLRMVFNWILFAFSGYLSCDETLQLWDRLLGYDSIMLLPVTAVAILSYRRDNLLLVDSNTAAEAILADISTIRVIPVLVCFLSGKKL